MAYNQFTTLQKTLTAFALRLEDADAFGNVAGVLLSHDFTQRLQEGTDLALSIRTEKAKAEWIVAPVLLEIKRRLGKSINVFSGVELNVDTARGLTGFCDFIITNGGTQHILTSPLVTIVESKNDNIGDGLGQCVAEMYAAQKFNRDNGSIEHRVYGIVTIGVSWKFLWLDQDMVTINIPEYTISQPEKIIGVLLHILT